MHSKQTWNANDYSEEESYQKLHGALGNIIISLINYEVKKERASQSFDCALYERLDSQIWLAADN